jgi:hypothetical protein
MSNKGKGAGKILGWLVAIAAGIGIGYLIFSPTEESLDQAVTKSHVEAGIQAADETSATISARKSSSAPGKLTIVIPAGTPIRNADLSGQWLMTARAVTFRLTDKAPEATQQVETYCLHQFDDPPTLKSQLSIASFPNSSMGSGVSEEETEPLHKLASCLANETEGRETRNLAIWMLSDHHAGKSFDEVKEELQRQYRRQAEAKLPGDLAGNIRETMRRQFPGVSDERLGQEIEYYRQNTLEKRIAAEAEQKTQEELKGFLAVKPLLEKCGSKPGGMRFFQTAP